MVRKVSYSEAREHLVALWDRVLAQRQPIRLTGHGTGDVVLVAADEYEGLIETVHLLRSPANAARLLAALERARRGDGELQSLDELRAEFGHRERR